MIAKLRDEIFKMHDSALLIGDSYSSYWAGGNRNEPVRCRIDKTCMKVYINDKWWDVDEHDWIVINN